MNKTAWCYIRGYSVFERCVAILFPTMNNNQADPEMSEVNSRHSELVAAIVAGHEKPSTFERHAQTVIAALITLLVGWVGFTILQVQKDQADFRLETTGVRSNIVANQRIMKLEISNLSRVIIENANPLPITRNEYTIHEHLSGKRFFGIERENAANGERLNLVESLISNHEHQQIIDQ
jgi:hypothetical protein